MTRRVIRDNLLNQTYRPYPTLRVEDIETLEALYPPRCLEKNESVEDHLRYAGKVELIASLRGELPQPVTAINLTPEEQAAADLDAAIAVAEQTQDNQDQQ